MPPETVTTRYGALRGIVRDDVVCFYDVPYARPPVGPLRFAESLPPEPWTGVRDATAPGLIAPQPPAGLGSYVPGDPVAQGEDCLSLNIFSAAGQEARRPVALFVHGGAFQSGTGASVMYDGTALARAGVVVVTINYRLGALGLLSHPGLAYPGSNLRGNWALSDVLLALEFVSEHAASFGGDASNVTIFGESSGAMIIADLLGAPRARGLFAKAVLESGAVLVDHVVTASTRAEELCRLLGLPGVERSELERLPVGEIVAASSSLADSLGGMLSMPFRPVVGAGVLPRHPANAIRAGAAAGIDLLIGTNGDEFKLFTVELSEESFADDATLTELTGRLLGSVAPQLDEQASSVLEQYRRLAQRRGHDVTAKGTFEAIANDAVFRLPALRLAEAQARHAAVYCYRFDWCSPFMNGALGACHGIELPFIFGTFINPVIALFAGGGEYASAFGSEVQGAWARFMAEGDPSGGSLGRWPQYLPGRRTMLLAATPSLFEAPGEEERQLFETLLPRYGDDEVFATKSRSGT